MHRIKLITSDATLLKWKTLSEKKAEILTALNQAEQSSFSIDIEHRAIVPDVVNGNITHAWMDTISLPLFAKGYDFVAFHMSDKQRKEWKVKPSLRGSHHNDKDEVAEFYFWSNERTKRDGYPQFVQTFLHEFCHAYFKGANLPDITHVYHEHSDDISGLLASFDMSLYQRRRFLMRSLISAATKLIPLLRKKLASSKPKLTHPIPTQYQTSISQAFLVENDTYISGVHNGTDWALPEGTPIFAPAQGAVTIRLQGAQTGYSCYYVFTHENVTYTMRILHLLDLPEWGERDQGDIIGYSGNTGTLTTGPHCHIDLWRGDVEINKIKTKEGVLEYLIDPETFFAP